MPGSPIRATVSAMREISICFDLAEASRSYKRHNPAIHRRQQKRGPMFRMLTCFNLRPGTSIQEFSSVYFAFVDHMQDLDLVEGSGPIGRRQSDSELDTDAEREHEYFALMDFRDRAQADRALAHIRPRQNPTEALHREVLQRARQAVFLCWEDI